MITSSIFKHVSQLGVSVVDYQFWSNVTMIVLAGAMIAVEGRNPLKAIPTDEPMVFLARLIFGQLGLFLYFYALTMAPMTLINVVVKTDAFFVFIFAYFVNGE